LEFDLEGIKLSIQKEEKEKFETKIVLENLKDFSLSSLQNLTKVTRQFTILVRLSGNHSDPNFYQTKYTKNEFVW